MRVTDSTTIEHADDLDPTPGQRDEGAFRYGYGIGVSEAADVLLTLADDFEGVGEERVSEILRKFGATFLTLSPTLPGSMERPNAVRLLRNFCGYAERSPAVPDSLRQVMLDAATENGRPS